MKVNKEFQNLHLEGSNNQWIEKQILEKDILLLYHQLSNYSYLMGDLYYNEIYQLQYWRYLSKVYWTIDINDEDTLFIETGCLVMIATMAWEIIDGTGAYILRFLDVVKNAVTLYEPIEVETKELKEMVLKILKHAKSNKKSNAELESISVHIHKKFVRNYYKKKAYEFDNNAYYK